MDPQDEASTVSRSNSGPENADRTARTQESWQRPVDRLLLEAFRRSGPDSRPLVAARLGLHLKYAEQRCQELESSGYLRSVDGHIYEVTEHGKARLDNAVSAD